MVIIVGAAVLLLWIPLRQRPGLGTLSNVASGVMLLFLRPFRVTEKIVAGDCTGADCAVGAELEQAVMSATAPRAETSSAAVRRARLRSAGRLPACPRPGTVPGRR